MGFDFVSCPTRRRTQISRGLFFFRAKLVAGGYMASTRRTGKVVTARSDDYHASPRTTYIYSSDWTRDDIGFELNCVCVSVTCFFFLGRPYVIKEPS